MKRDPDALLVAAIAAGPRFFFDVTSCRGLSRGGGARRLSSNCSALVHSTLRVARRLPPLPISSWHSPDSISLHHLFFSFSRFCPSFSFVYLGSSRRRCRPRFAPNSVSSDPTDHLWRRRRDGCRNLYFPGRQDDLASFVTAVRPGLDRGNLSEIRSNLSRGDPLRFQMRRNRAPSRAKAVLVDIPFSLFQPARRVFPDPELS